MKVQKKERTDNPLTDHSDEPDSIDIVKQGEKTDDEPKEKVLSTEPPEKDDDEGDSSGPTPRQQKRRARYDEMQQRADEAERRAQEAEARANALWAAQQVQAQQPQKQTDPFEEEEKAIKEAWDKHQEQAKLLARGCTPEQEKQWRDGHYEIQRRGQDLAAKRQLAASGFQPGQRVNLAEEALKAQLAADYSDVVTNNRYLSYADGLARQRSAQMGRGLSRTEFDDVMNETRRVFRLPTAKSAAPSQQVRQKFSGSGLGGATNGANGAGNSQIRMNEDMMAMAEAKYTHEIDPKTGKKRKLTKAEAHAKWAQNEGKRVAEKFG